MVKTEDLEVKLVSWVPPCGMMLGVLPAWLWAAMMHITSYPSHFMKGLAYRSV